MADVTKHNKAVNTHKSRIAFFMVFFSFQLVFLNAPSSTDNHYTMLVNHDFNQGG